MIRKLSDFDDELPRKYKNKDCDLIDISGWNVYDRINFKACNDIFDLDAEERDALEDMIIEDFAERVRRMSDENLIDTSVEYGAF